MPTVLLLDDYTVTYEDADGNVLTGTQESVEEVAPKDQDMQAKIKGANSPLITAGHHGGIQLHERCTYDTWSLRLHCVLR